jgi:hypothetical protein
MLKPEKPQNKNKINTNIKVLNLHIITDEAARKN